MHAIIDGDLVTFSCAAYNEPFGWEACQDDLDALMERILETVEATEYTIFLTGDNNFRYEINPNYKANRKDKSRPSMLEQSREYLVTKWNAKITEGIEADDAIGILAGKLQSI